MNERFFETDEGHDPEAEVHATILPMWRPNIEAVSELRKVEEIQA